MTKNDILRRIRYILDLSDINMIELFSLVENTITIEQLHEWFRDENHQDYQPIRDSDMAAFLNGLIKSKRGEKPGSQPKIETELTNNKIFMKLKIALNLKSEDVIEILQTVDFSLSKHELSAFFRKPGHKHYRECKDQIMRNFLMGLQLTLRPKDTPAKESIWN